MEVGYVEFLMVILFALAALVFFGFKLRFAQVLTPLAICMAIAAITTPSDPVSCLFFGFLLFAAYQIGGRFSTRRAPNLG